MGNNISGRSADLYKNIMGLICDDDSKVAVLGALGAVTASVLEDAHDAGLPAGALFAGFCGVVSNVIDGRALS